MKTIQTILEDFERKFEYGMCEREKVKTFIRTAFDEYKKELREAVEVKREEVSMQPHFPNATSEFLKRGRLEGFDSVLELLK